MSSPNVPPLRLAGRRPGGTPPPGAQGRPSGLLIPDGKGGFESSSAGPRAIPAHVACQLELARFGVAFGAEGARPLLESMRVALAKGEAAGEAVTVEDQWAIKSVSLLVRLQEEAREHVERLTAALKAEDARRAAAGDEGGDAALPG